MEQTSVRSFVWYLGVLAACLAGGLVGNLSTTLLLIIINETLFYFLSLCFTALLASLCAVFAGNVLAVDEHRARLWFVVGVSEVAAILVALANTVLVTYPVIYGVSITPVSLGQQMMFNTVAISLVSTAATWSLRRPPTATDTDAPKDTISAVLLILLALLLMVSGIVIYDMLVPGA